METTDHSTPSDAELAELRQALRDFLERRAPAAAAIAEMENPVGYDAKTWKQLCVDFAATSMSIPERFGGLGFGWRATGAVLQECGAVVYGGPQLSAVIAADALLLLADAQTKDELLPKIADGSHLCTLAATQLTSPGDAGAVRAVAHSSGPMTSWVLTGSVPNLLYGPYADTFLVLATGPDGHLLFRLPRSATGLRIRRLGVMDLTRPLARLDLDGAHAEPVSSGPIDATVLTTLSGHVAVALAAEQAGGAERALRETVEYSRTRVQYGRTIGSFQSVKHRLADLLVAVEGASAVLADALNAIDRDRNDVELAAHIAAATCADTYLQVARAMIQIHGGIGFTWEHPAHLHLKRAKSGQLLLRSPMWHRRQLARLLSLAG